ncbi:hypothetical protein A1O7_06526 [Cladophialophora yegresii CBS 114405]|uniref:Uncharacterized protein n=1 Tax=Cladophialophora yegresii CBS 114405 TaxID=1182544 RepID=W9W274_9EURO|nr:uncharacterized protein A1O7_06526 [Cladophialophora yegresii CBS 114405]EXJ59095.1 hypothetical protein A1O7_06526 [Cladophialophora yegresii CBS 114405]
MQLLNTIIALVAAFTAYVEQQTTDLVVAFRERAFQPVFHNFLAIEPSTIISTVTSTVTASPTVSFTTTVYHGGSIAVVATSAPPPPPAPTSTTVPQVQYCLAPLAWANWEEPSVCMSEHAFERLSAFLATLSEEPTLHIPQLILARLSSFFSLHCERIRIATSPVQQWTLETMAAVVNDAISIGGKIRVEASGLICPMRDFLASLTLPQWLIYCFLFVTTSSLLISASIIILGAELRRRDLLQRMQREEEKSTRARRWNVIAEALEFYEQGKITISSTKEEARKLLVDYLISFITSEKQPEFPPPTIQQRCPELRRARTLWTLACGLRHKLFAAMKWMFDVQCLFLVETPLRFSWRVIIRPLGEGVVWLFDMYVEKFVLGIMPFCFLLMVNVLSSLLGLSMAMGLVCLGVALAVLLCGIHAVSYAMLPVTRFVGRLRTEVVNELREALEGARESLEAEEAVRKAQKHNYTLSLLARRTPETPDQPIAQPNHWSVPFSKNTSVPTHPSPRYGDHFTSDPSVTTPIISFGRLQRLLSLETEYSTISEKLQQVPGFTVIAKIDCLLRWLPPHPIVGFRRPVICDKCSSKDAVTKAQASENALAETQQLKKRVQELESELGSQNETHDSAEVQQLKTKTQELESRLSSEHEKHDSAEKQRETKVQELESRLRSQNETHDSAVKQHQAKVQELESELRSRQEKHEEEVKKLRQEAHANAKRAEAKTQELEQVQAHLSQTQKLSSNETAVTSQVQETINQHLAAAAEREVTLRAECQAHIELLMTAGREVEVSRDQQQAEVERLITAGRQVEAEAESLRGKLQTEKSAHAATKVQLDAMRTRLEQTTQALVAERQSAAHNEGAMAVDEPGHLRSNPSGNGSTFGTGFNQPATSGGDEALRVLRETASNWHNQQQRARSGAMSSAQPPAQTATSRGTQPAAGRKVNRPTGFTML